MKRNFKAGIAFLVAIALSGSLAARQNQLPNPGVLQYVDPTIGAVGHLLEPTRPTMHLPNSMVRVYPIRKDQLDDQISYFPLSMYSHRIGNLFSVMPYRNAKQPVRATSDLEKTAPHYYTVALDEPGVRVEFSPAERSGFYRFTATAVAPVKLRIGVINEGNMTLTGKRIITGTEQFKGMQAFVYAELDTAVTLVQRKDPQAKIIFLETNAAVVQFKYGISFISIEQAKANLQKEIPHWSFDQVKNRAAAIWEKTLGQIQVAGGTAVQKRAFYTALYRSYERMVDISEYGRYYSAYDHKVHTDKRPHYADNWIWDMYLAQEPLHTILDPEKEGDKIQSYVKMYQQSGWMPSFALVFGDNPCMTGNHAAAWMADAWFKGVRNFELKKAYEGVRKNSLEATLLPWKNGPRTQLDSFYAVHGYFPALRTDEKETVAGVDPFEKRQAVAITLQQSYDDWCLSRLAKVVKADKDETLFVKKAGNYKNVFRTDKGFMWPKDSEGEWIEPFDPKFSGGLGGRQYFTENNAYTYNWDVKHDLSGLFTLMGGIGQAEAKLDQLFREDLGRGKYNFQATFPDATGLVGQFVMGNEPSFHIPYLYNYMGAPWKSQKRIRSLLATWFGDHLFSIPGDEDGGGMSAFVVFSMMGFYPVTPGIPVYTIGSPVFNEMSIKLSNGKIFTLTARNNSETNKYIQSAKLNGQTWDKPWFSHDDVIKGGKLELVMGELPNKTWGSKITDAPPSAMQYN
ncbi:GH92 family glycosyl hydrolase [Pedobacter sp. MR2016-24]|uniref:GH92 family glycosyl hydrolase n=1 Tax=Pedobacter sp. MR2016-24 TaxID=2994466 RepID=UPI00224532F9|nr:GH92 family glycosyl hydrolase [Pedobacter sp. MR2016-24]MCX2486203.1 GH92 family glycosyl hydrolase [Pedobacter sp. MR2016-24]